MADYNGFSINLSATTSAGGLSGTSINTNLTVRIFRNFSGKWLTPIRVNLR